MAIITRVNRGDLITAEFFNQLLDTLNGLDTRLSVLEGSGPTSPDQVVIAALEPPSGSVRVGQDLTIRGRNFGQSAGRLRVFIDDLPINNFNRPGTNDETIIITIPTDIGSPPLAGRAAQLTVSNSFTTAQRTITLMPTADVIGTVPLTLRSTDAAPAAGTNFTMLMHLESQLSRVAVVQLTATVTGIGSTPQLLTSALTPMDAQFQLEPRQALDFAVRTPIPAGAGTPAFTVTITVTVDGVQRGLQSSPFTVGTAAEQPDPTILVPMPAAGAVAPASAGGFNAGVLRLTAPGAIGELTFQVTVSAIGDYTAVPTLDSGTGWTPIIFDNAAFHIGDSDLAPGGRAVRLVRLRVTVAAGATPGFVRLRIRRATGNGTSQIVTVATA